MVINLSQLSVGYSLSHLVVSDINSKLRSGQLVCLIGENGVGKSIFLETFTSLLPKSKGSLLLDNRDIGSLSQRELARQVSTVLIQRPDVQNLTTEEIIGLGRSPYTGFLGRLYAEDRRVVDDAIVMMGIKNLRGGMIRTLSDDERQRVMIVKALAQETLIILPDESTAFLDFPSKTETFQSLQRMAHGRDKLILLSTHDLELAVYFADSLLEVKEGALQTVSASEVKASICVIIDS